MSMHQDQWQLMCEWNGFCFADVVVGRNHVSWAVLGVMLVVLENPGGLVSQVWNDSYILRAFNVFFPVIPKYS